jgi:hypothetical protein
MGWVKRNLFFVIGGILALGLLGAAGYYDLKGWKRNTEALQQLTDTYNTLKDLTSQKPSPGNEKINNIAAAKEQERELRDWIQQAGNYFQPIPPIPLVTNGLISGEIFGSALHRTIDQLTRDAMKSSVNIPQQYSFSFQALRDRVEFAPGGLDALATQLGEVKTICGILFAARVNQLDGIERARASDDDTGGPQTDYLTDAGVTNNLVVMTPYIVTFRSFSPEIAQVLSGFASSPNGFIVKGINVQPASSDLGTGGQPPPPPPPVNLGGLQTILQEQLLRVTIEVEIVKLSPRN